jgi:hypothetical protein
MNDREMLEMAAKAAGYDYKLHHVGGNDYAISIPDHPARFWKPLESDGDALRLAVKLRLDLHFEDQPNWIGEIVEAMGPENSEGARLCKAAPLFEDPYAAVRLAIVRAAAAIGEKT